MQWAALISLIVVLIRLALSGQLYSGILVADTETAEEGETVTLKCFSASHHQWSQQEYSFYLFKNGKKVQTQPSVRGQKNVTFILQRITVEQSGKYSCAFGNDSPEYLEDANNNSLSLTVKESQLLLLLQIDEKNSAAGHDLDFTCWLTKEKRIKNNPQGSFELRKDGVLVSSQSVLQLSAAKFKIKNVNLANDGTYMCVFRLGDFFTVKSKPYIFTSREMTNGTDGSPDLHDAKETGADPNESKPRVETYFVANVIRLSLSALVCLVLFFLVCDASRTVKRTFS